MLSFNSITKWPHFQLYRDKTLFYRSLPAVRNPIGRIEKGFGWPLLMLSKSSNRYASRIWGKISGTCGMDLTFYSISIKRVGVQIIMIYHLKEHGSRYQMKRTIKLRYYRAILNFNLCSLVRLLIRLCDCLSFVEIVWIAKECIQFFCLIWLQIFICFNFMKDTMYNITI